MKKNHYELISGKRDLRLLIILLMLILGGLVTIFGTTNSNKNSAMKVILLEEVNKYPKMEIQDLYKLLHQASMGSEHAVKNEEAVKNWMKNEIAGLRWGQSDNFIDTISVDGKILRINLRPYIKKGYSTNKLVEVFIKTANNFKGSYSELEESLEIALELSKTNMLPFDHKEMVAFFDQMKEKKYPAVHHSKVYAENYFPAYRVIAAEYIEELFLK
jgi:hypothetical protein